MYIAQSLLHSLGVQLRQLLILGGETTLGSEVHNQHHLALVLVHLGAPVVDVLLGRMNES